MLVACLALLLTGGAAVYFGVVADPSGPGPTGTPSANGTASGSSRSPATAAAPAADPAGERRDGVVELLDGLARAVNERDRAAYLDLIDTGERRFRAQQGRVFNRIVKVPFASYEYVLAGEGPALPAARAAALPEGSAIIRAQVAYRYVGSRSSVEREQYLTVVPRGGRWLLAGDADGAASGSAGEPDIWDLGAINVVRGRASIVVGNPSAAELRRFAREADQAVRDIAHVWRYDWSRRPVVVVPASQKDMAALIGSNGKGLAQIAAVTTGYSESGTTRGDRVVINPAAWSTLGPLGRRVVMTHEITHLATRASTDGPVPIWLSEGFADYVAYQAVDLPTRVIADDVLDEVRDGKGPRELPRDRDFDAARSEVSASYEGAWLAARLVAERYGEARLVRLYRELADRRGGTPEQDMRRVLGIGPDRLTRQWLAYLEMLAQ